MEGATQTAPRPVRLAGGPISWGVCEVPGWGVQLPPERVLAEMRAAGLTAVEAGPDGYLGSTAATVSRLLAEHGLRLVGGFVPAVLHLPGEREGSFSNIERVATLYAQAGAEILVSAVATDTAWSPRKPLASGAWDAILDGLDRLDELAARHGLRHALHPHVGTLVETADDVERVVEGSDVGLCLDTGHLVLGGVDTIALARDAAERIVHVHLKDVRTDLADALRRGELTLLEATRRGAFLPLGDGGAPIAETIDALGAAGYGGWYVLEQDTTLAESAQAESDTKPIDDTRRSLAYLRRLGLVEQAAPTGRAREVSRPR
jgi:inosose dehydratase